MLLSTAVYDTEVILYRNWGESKLLGLCSVVWWGPCTTFTFRLPIYERQMKTNIMLFFFTVCPLFWRRFATDQGVYCFKLITEFMTWHDARDKCGEYGADLSSVRGEEEADFVKNQVQLCG